MKSPKAEEARESHTKTRMKEACKNRQIHSAGECPLISTFLIVFAFICVIRGQLPDL